ncbi:MAG: FmdB family zinc ribbon protein [Thermoguttaceae bacterium]
MPTYEYQCSSCGHNLEEFQYISDPPLEKCPACKKKKLRRLISGGAAIVFKGSGFYQTDYRSEAYKKAASADKSGASTPSTSSTSGESSAPAPAATTPATPSEKKSTKPTSDKA